MLAALGFITFQHWRKHRPRVLLTILSVALGVAVFFAVQTAGLTLRTALQQTVEQIAGKATLQITAGEAGLPEDILEAVRATPGVVFAEPVIEMVARPALNGGDLLIIGVDVSGDQKIREYEFDESQLEIDNPLTMVTRANSLVVSRAFAEAHRLRAGDKLQLHTSQGPKEFTVCGMFKTRGIGEVFGGRIAVMDIYAAQVLFSRGHNVDRIDVMHDPSLTVDGVQQRLREHLPPGLRVARPASREQSMENWVAAMQLGLTVMSFLALIVGVFIIFNSFSISVNQRWKEIGILRSIGVEQLNVQRWFLAEAVLVGLLGAGIGVAAGFYLAALVAHVMSAVAGAAYGKAFAPQAPVFHLNYALVSLTIGVVASLMAAWLPARAASRLDPVRALHNIETRQREDALSRRRTLAGLLLILAGVALIGTAPPKVDLFIQFTYCGMIQLGFILLLPKLVSSMTRALRPLMDRVFGAEGALAADSMIQAPRRTSATIGALMIGLSFVFSTEASVQSQQRSVLRSIDRTLSADLLITASASLRSLMYRFDEKLGEQVAAIAGVSSVENKRFTFAPYNNDSVALVATDTEVWLARAGDIIDGGDWQATLDSVPQGRAAIVAQNFSTRWGRGVGDTVNLETPTGTLTLPIVAVMEDYHSEKGTIFIDRALYKTYWKDETVDYLLIALGAQANAVDVRREIDKLTSAYSQSFVYTNEEYKAWVQGLIGQFFILNKMQMLIALFVAVVGIINTLTISVAERRREFGVIRAIGGARKQIRKMVWLEAMMLGIIGVLMGALCGVFNTYFLTRTASTMIAGFSLPFHFPVVLVLLTVPLVMVIAIVAAWLPARHASRLNVVEALGCE